MQGKPGDAPLTVTQIFSVSEKERKNARYSLGIKKITIEIIAAGGGVTFPKFHMQRINIFTVKAW